MFQLITLFDYKLERMNTSGLNFVLERDEWKELSSEFDHQPFCGPILHDD